MKRLVFVLVFACSACIQPPPNLTPQAQVAFSADQVVQRVNELENAVIQANSSGALSTNATRVIVEFCVTSDQTLKSAPVGWQATITTAWNSLKAQSDFPKNPSPSLAAIIGTFDAAITSFGAP